MSVERFAMFGDTNGTPDESGKWSNQWVADSIPCDYVIPDNGKHGRIDSIWTNCPVADLGRIAGKNPDLDRLPGGGSDHGLIIGKIRNPETGRWYTFAFWNVERDRRGREIHQMVEFLEKVIRKYKVDFVCLQESQEYHRQLRALGQRQDMRLIANPKRGWGHNTILVSTDIKTTNPRYPFTTKDGWTTAGGAEHPPLHMTCVTLDGWLRAASIHSVPSVHVRKGRLIGPARRQTVYKQGQQSYVDFGRQNS